MLAAMVSLATGSATMAQQAAVQLRPAVPAQPASAGAAIGIVAGGAAGQVEPPEEAAKGVAPAAAPSGPVGFSPTELARMRATYDALTEPERAEMVAFYKDMGVDLEVALGLKTAAPVMASLPLPDALRALDFSRKPDAVLAARSQLGFSGSAMPDRSNGDALAKWLHMNVLAGEWQALDAVLAQCTPADATAVYSHILRSTNAGVQGLLPEEVLALGDACPGEMQDWQVDTLAQMLAASASRYGKGQFLTRIREGTRLFGAGDEKKRERTLRLLVGGGLATEAFEFLPSLEKARESGDARVVYAHARYHEELAASGLAGDATESHLTQGWALMGDVALMNSADVALRRDAMRRAIDSLESVPPAQATEWLSRVFANEALGPAALEIVAMQAMTFRDKRVDAAKRAQGIASMKSAVDTLLAQPGLNMESLRVPLRMLTTALADEVDLVVREKGEQRGVAREAEILFRSSPGEKWLGAIEPSVALRGYRASISVATICDEVDVALDVLAAAVKRFPDQGIELADGFLQLWEKRLNPKANPNEMENYYFFYMPQRVPSAPLTRGRQHRNLDKLERLLGILDTMGVKGLQLPTVTAAFQACHAKSEVFDREEIVRVFGPVEKLPAPVAAALSESMRVGLGGDWRNRQVQRAYGMSRSAAEIGVLVEAGYELAIELATRAVQGEPESWRHAVLRAALSYDRVQFKQSQQKDDFSKYNEYRRQALAAFEQASAQYAGLVTKGLEHDSAGVYMRWFSAVLDAGQPVADDKNALAAEDALNDDQVARIGKAMRALPDEAYERHVAAFARDIADAMAGIPPERKPSIVRAAVRIVGEHPAGAPLRRLAELYEDLLKNEIRLRLTVDGTDKVAAGQMFGVSLTLRYTNSVDRETGGFDKYLYQDAYVRVGNQYRSVNYQAQIRKSLESALANGFTVESIGFFEPMTPSRSVKEDGDAGWQEKPLAYLLLKAKDPSVDRLPQVSFDMHFDDNTGPVTLPIVSNSPPIDATATAPTSRPLKALHVQQTVDARRLIEGSNDRAVTIEVQAKGEGVIPEITELLAGLKESLPGYSVGADGVEARPYAVVQTDAGTNQRFFFNQNQDENKEYSKADETGMFRLATERSWVVTLKPDGGRVAKELKLPVLHEGIAGALESRQYADMDVVKVSGTSVGVVPRWSITMKLGLVLVGLVLFAGCLLLYFRRRAPQAAAVGGSLLPSRITPLSTIAALQRIASQGGRSDDQVRALRDEIAGLERSYFGPDAGASPDPSRLRAALERWITPRAG
jgi:hypothetical protein